MGEERIYKGERGKSDLRIVRVAATAIICLSAGGASFDAPSVPAIADLGLDSDCFESLASLHGHKESLSLAADPTAIPRMKPDCARRI